MSKFPSKIPVLALIAALVPSVTLPSSSASVPRNPPNIQMPSDVRNNWALAKRYFEQRKYEKALEYIGRAEDANHIDELTDDILFLKAHILFNMTTMTYEQFGDGFTYPSNDVRNRQAFIDTIQALITTNPDSNLIRDGSVGNLILTTLDSCLEFDGANYQRVLSDVNYFRKFAFDNPGKDRQYPTVQPDLSTALALYRLALENPISRQTRVQAKSKLDTALDTPITIPIEGGFELGPTLDSATSFHPFWVAKDKFDGLYSSWFDSGNRTATSTFRNLLSIAGINPYQSGH